MPKLYSVFSDGSYGEKKSAGLGAIVISCSVVANDNRSFQVADPQIESILSAPLNNCPGSLYAEFMAAAKVLNAIPEDHASVALHGDLAHMVDKINEGSLAAYADQCNPLDKEAVLALKQALERHRNVRAFQRSDGDNALIRACHHFSRAGAQGKKLDFRLPTGIPVPAEQPIIFSKKASKPKSNLSKKQKKIRKQVQEKLSDLLQEQIPDFSKTPKGLSDKERESHRKVFNGISAQLEKEHPDFKIDISYKSPPSDPDELTLKAKVMIRQKKGTMPPLQKEHNAARDQLKRATFDDALSGFIEANDNLQWLLGIDPAPAQS